LLDLENRGLVIILFRKIINVTPKLTTNLRRQQNAQFSPHSAETKIHTTTSLMILQFEL